MVNLCSGQNLAFSNSLLGHKSPSLNPAFYSTSKTIPGYALSIKYNTHKPDAHK